MKILYIHTKYLQSAGGEDTAVEAESQLMRRKGHEVRVQLFDNAQMGRGFTGKLNAGISAIYNRSSAKTVRKVINEYKPDIVHVHNFFFTASPSVLHAIHDLRIPLVVTIHNYRLICTNALLLRNNKVCELCVNLDFPWYGVKYKCYHDSAIQSAMVAGMAAVHKWSGTWKNKVDLYITPAFFSKNRLIHSSFNVRAEKIEVKRNFISDPGIGSMNERKNHFLFVGRLSAEKGVQVLLEAWTGLPEAELIVAGDGPEREKLERMYGHLQNIQFAGRQQRENVIEMMKNCKALIFPSIWYEGLPMTIIESFATGTPVIGSDIGAMSEMISHQVNGLLFEAGNPVALRQSVRDFMNEAGNWQYSLYENARNSYMKEYHPEKCYESIMYLYNKTITSKNIPAAR